MTTWRSKDLLAWTGHDGPGRPPAGSPRLLALVVAGSLTVVFAGVLATDALCPEHRAWTDALAGMSLLAAVAAVVGLVRGWASAGVLALVSASGGVAIGIIDAGHDPTRGRALAVLFAGVAVAALAVAVSGLRLRHWDRSVLEAQDRADAPREQPVDGAGPVADRERPRTRSHLG